MMESSQTIRSDAIGIYSTANNPDYLWEDFIKVCPQFEGLIPSEVFTLFRNLAMKTLSVEQWGQEAWTLGMMYFIAHFLTLYLKATPVPLDEESQVTADDIISSAAPGGLLKEKAANTLKMVYDNSISTSGLEGTGTFLLTSYGQMYLTMAKFTRMPMYV